MKGLGRMMRRVTLTMDEIYGLVEAVDRGLDDRVDYMNVGNPHTDYGEEWPEVARTTAQRWRHCASALRKLGGPPVYKVQGEFYTMAESCEEMAERLDASAAEYEAECRTSAT